MVHVNCLSFVCYLLGICHAIPWEQHDYYFSDQPENYYNALETCTDKGGLVSVLSREENDFIASRIPSGYWIGLTTNVINCTACTTNDNSDECRECKASWYWTDGSPMHYTNWARREPSGITSCVRIKTDNKWWDAPSCALYKYYAVCKRHLCETKDCGSYGICSAASGTAWCDCTEGYSGTPCTEIDECIGMTCNNNGTCIDGVAAYKCECSQGYEGNNCEIDVDECNSGPCRNGGICVDLPGSFLCHCKCGYTGHSCEKEEEASGLKTQQSHTTSGLVSRQTFGGSLGVAVFIIVAMLVIILVLLMRKRSTPSQKLGENGPSMLLYSHRNSAFDKTVSDDYAERTDDHMGLITNI